jgi:hypothetical protein
MLQIKRAIKSQKRRKTVLQQRRASELPQSGMSFGYGEIEDIARRLLMYCVRCEKEEVCVAQQQPPHDLSQDVLTNSKQVCAALTHRSGARDYLRHRFIGILIHAVRKYSPKSAAPVDFVCSACAGYADFKFDEDAEVVKTLSLQRSLEDVFGIRADALHSYAESKRYKTSCTQQATVSSDVSSENESSGEEDSS